MRGPVGVSVRAAPVRVRSGMSGNTRALRVAAFRRLWSAQLISEAGDWMALIVAAALLYQRHHSALQSGLVFVVRLLPQVGIGQWLSTFADRRPRRTFMLLADAVRAAVFVLLGLGAAHLSGPVVLS